MNFVKELSEKLGSKHQNERKFERLTKVNEQLNLKTSIVLKKNTTLHFLIIQITRRNPNLVECKIQHFCMKPTLFFKLTGNATKALIPTHRYKPTPCTGEK